MKIKLKSENDKDSYIDKYDRIMKMYNEHKRNKKESQIE